MLHPQVRALLDFIEARQVPPRSRSPHARAATCRSHSSCRSTQPPTASHDPLRDEGKAFVARLTTAGNRASSVCFDRQIHGFITMGKLIDEANTAVALGAAELKRALG